MNGKIYGKPIACAVIIFLLTAADQFTKWLAVIHLKGSTPLILLDGILELRYLENDGAAWGMLSGWQAIFKLLSVAVFALLIYMIAKTPAKKRYLLAFAVYILLFSGALGNFIDRMRNGYVVDFIYFKLIDFPVFNIADSFVTIAMVLFAIGYLFVYQEGEFAFLKPQGK